MNKSILLVSKAFFLSVLTLFFWTPSYAEESGTETHQTAPAQIGQEGDRQIEAEEAQRALDEFLRRQKLLFKPGEVQIEFSTSYSHETAENIRLRQKFGDEYIEEVVPKFITRTTDVSLLGRFGLVDDLEFNLSVPFVYLNQQANYAPFEVSGIPQFIEQDNEGLGDVRAAFRYAVAHEDENIADMILNLDVKSRTGDEEKSLGTGHWNVGGGFTLVKTSDPVVLFGSLGYTSTLEREGRDPGDEISYSLGMGFSLNDRVSFIMSTVGAIIREDRIDGENVEGSGRDIHNLQFSVTVQLTKHLFLEPVLGVGLTEDATDFYLGINIPYQLITR